MSTPSDPAPVRRRAPGAQTVRRAMSLLRLVAESQEQGLRLTDLCAMSGLQRPTVHRLLQALIEESAIEQDGGTRRYRIGTEMLLLGLARPGGLPMRAAADSYLMQLAQRAGDTVFLSLRHGSDSVCIARHTGHYAIQVLSIEIGVRRPLGASVSGVILLTGMEPAQARALVTSNEPRLLHHGVHSAQLLRRVQQARQSGFTFAAAGVMPGTSAMAVPVRSAQGQVLAAISIAAMAHRLARPRVLEVRAMMQDTAMSIGRRLVELDTARSRRRGTRSGGVA